MAIFEGAGTAIVTPFKNGKIDFDALGKLLEWQVAEGIDAIIITGTTGEASTQTDDEQIEAIKFAVDTVAKRIPVIAGVGSNDTKHGIHLSQRAEKAGVDGLLHVTPYYNKTSKPGLIKHFTMIAESVSAPIILYSVPGRTGLNITPEIVAEVAKVPNIVAIKEATGNISQVVEIARISPPGFDMYSGNDDMIIPLMSVGGIGVISVLSNILPKETHEMADKYLKGDIKGAAALQLKYKKLIDLLFCEVNPIPVKAALYMMGKIEYEYRMPLCQMEEGNYAKLKAEMEVQGLI
ncbi:MAG: 4-hydroxy-tetrahydrodipicolinate synthase [Clostridiales Family XIII bacterium]|jgi:4-hydroxy-tetrahydrodipicolinate synthase|nr:4-hydroxy-tetrahydrodipicolinate synthase [Clostridiales Family XIII bacterium]